MSPLHHSAGGGSKRVLIVRLGSMGDIVHALPAVCYLAEEWKTG